MTPFPKHYLADVPQELRLRVLDLCVHRRWHDGLDLLHQNGFTQYEWWEVVWFHDHAPTNLPDVECGGSTPLSISRSEISNGRSEIASSCGVPLSDGPEYPEPNLNALPPCSSVVSASSVLKSARPRSKIARLPEDIQDNLNAMLASGCPYANIIRCLNDRGYPGFNKVNLHTWKLTGFQNWLRIEREATTSEAAQAVSETGSNR